MSLLLIFFRFIPEDCDLILKKNIINSLYIQVLRNLTHGIHPVRVTVPEYYLQ